jgi:hypothetical protein
MAVSTALLPPAALASDGTTWTQINLPNVTANAHADGQTGDGVDNFDGSYNQVDGVKYFH